MRTFPSWLCLLGLSSTLMLTGGCVVSTGPGGPGPGPGPGPGGAARGDITFHWTFDQGQTCYQAGVDHVVVSIPGQPLQNNGSYACTTAGVDGIVLRDFDAGSYSFTLQAYDVNNAELYASSGTFNVNGNVQVTRDLGPVTQNPGAYGYLTWDFATATGTNVPTCNAGTGYSNDMTEVDLFEGSSTTPLARYSCSSGLGTGYRVSLPYLNPGPHTLTLASFDASGVEYAFQTQTVNVGPTAVETVFTLAWEVGDVTIAWSPAGGSCGFYGIVDMGFNLVDSSGNEIFARPAGSGSIGDGLSYFDVGSGNRYLCTDYAITYPAVPAGTYGVEVQGTGNFAGGYYSWSDPTYPTPEVSIQAGRFGSL